MSTRGGAVARRLSALRPMNELARWIAGLRGHRLVLVYHRVRERLGGGIVPTVSPATLAAHVQVLGEIGEIGPAGSLLAQSSTTIRFAVTFDDDYRSHVDHASQVLDRLGVEGTFFLCGRSLHGFGRLWFEHLDELIDDRGLKETARLLGLEHADIRALHEACLRDPSRVERLDPTSGEEPLDADGMRLLAERGMSIGFHTLHHPDMTRLANKSLRDALIVGRNRLESVCGSTIRLFAYPFGRADERVIGAAREAGYASAFTGLPAPVRPRSDPYAIGRWEPGPVGPDDFLTELAIRLHRSVKAPP